MYSLPSTSNIREPCPRAIKGGVPPTPRNARTGEFTPPGINFCDSANNPSDLDRFISISVYRNALRHHFAQKEIPCHLLQRAVQVLKQPFTQALVRLRSGENVLHDKSKPLTAPHETDHSLRNGLKQEAPGENVFGQHGSVFQIAREIAPQH